MARLLVKNKLICEFNNILILLISYNFEELWDQKYHIIHSCFVLIHTKKKTKLFQLSYVIKILVLMAHFFELVSSYIRQNYTVPALSHILSIFTSPSCTVIIVNYSTIKAGTLITYITNLLIVIQRLQHICITTIYIHVKYLNYRRYLNSTVV